RGSLASSLSCPAGRGHARRAGGRARRHGRRAGRSGDRQLRGERPAGGGAGAERGSRMTTARVAPWRGVIDAYRERMPVRDGCQIITLGEGGTPLLPAPYLSERTGCEVLLKVD